ncbi:hypothetical protein MMC13_007193 [Lambiella insularis]|nr:hypothetical protein [Lambiella insularis]
MAIHYGGDEGPQLADHLDQARALSYVNNTGLDLDKTEITLGVATASSQARLEIETRPGPKSRLASYLSAHRQHVSDYRVDVSSFDWAPPKDKDKVYDPDLEAMCNTLKARVLTFPSKDLPARYNNFVLRLIEGYQQALLEKDILQVAFDPDVRDDGVERGHHKELIRGRKSLETAPNRADAFIPRETGAIDEIDTPKKPKTNVFNRGWPVSPSRGMTRLSRKLLTINTNSGLQPLSVTDAAQRTVSPGGAQDALSSLRQDLQQTSGSDLSSVGGDLLPDEMEETFAADDVHRNQVIMRLANWLAKRIGSEPEVVLPDIANILSAYGELHGSSLELAHKDSNVESFPRSPAFCRARDKFEVERRPLQHRDKSSEGSSEPSLESQLKRQRRGFSFIPGDDSKVSQGYRSSAIDVSVRGVAASVGGITFGTEAISALDARPSAFPITAESQAMSTDQQGLFERENSNRSIMTTINIGSYSSSSPSLRMSCSSNETVRKSDSTSKKNSLATAAARVAGSVPGNLLIHSKPGAAKKYSGL